MRSRATTGCEPGRRAATMPKRSAGILLYRRPRAGAIELLLVHPGGPFWARKDAGAWSIPKGEYSAPGRTRSPWRGASSRRKPGSPPTVNSLPSARSCSPAARLSSAWALEGDFDPAALRSNTFELEWPPRSGRRQTFPEVDRAQWFSPGEAREKILPGQREVHPPPARRARVEVGRCLSRRFGRFPRSKLGWRALAIWAAPGASGFNRRAFPARSPSRPRSQR